MSKSPSKAASQDAYEARLYGYSDSSWASMSESDKELHRLIKPAPRAQYTVNVFLSRIEGYLETLESEAQKMGGSFTLTPDFQRGHVWDKAKQVAYVENYLRGHASACFKFNSPGYNADSIKGDINPHDVVCVDGLQRITALREFMADRLEVFGGKKASDFNNTPFDTRRTVFKLDIEVFAFPWRDELLDYYVVLNAGGVVHAPEEIARVKALSEDAKAQRQLAASSAEPNASDRRRRRSPR